jgi:hypothetical protein
MSKRVVMRMSRFAGMTLAGALSAAASGAMAGTHIQLAQADFGARMGPPRSPDVVIEEPRPPRSVIETEGRAEPRKCPSVNVPEPRDAKGTIRTERECDER